MSSSLSAEAVTQIPPQLVLELATGVEDPAAVAARYGFTPEQWEFLATWQPLVHAVETKRAELQKAGVTFRIKAGVYAEDMLDDFYLKAKNPEATILQKLESLKLLAKLADYEPKESKGAVVGPGTSIQIVFSNGQQPVTIEGTAVQKQETTEKYELPVWMKGQPVEKIEIGDDNLPAA